MEQLLNQLELFVIGALRFLATFFLVLGLGLLALFLLSLWWQWQNRDISGTFRTPFGGWTYPHQRFFKPRRRTGRDRERSGDLAPRD